MSKFAVVTLIAAVAYLLASVAVVAAKGPPAKVVIAGGNLTSEVVIEQADLAGIGPGFLGDSTNPPTAYASGVEIGGETPYSVTIFELDGDSGNELQQFLSEHYFPANSQHPSLLAQEGKLWKVLPALATLIDSRIKFALDPASLPVAGGPPADHNLDGWVFALFVTGASLLLGSVAAVSHSRRR